MSLSATIRQIRKRRGETTVKFGQRLGVHNSSVSLYENGKTVPSKTVLMLLYGLAESDEEKRVIVEALGELPEDLAVREASLRREMDLFNQELRGLIEKQRESPEIREWFSSLALRVVQMREIPGCIPDLLSLFVEEPRDEDFVHEIGILVWKTRMKRDRQKRN